MSKTQPKDYWYSTLTYKLTQATIIKGTLSDLDTHLNDWLDRSIIILKRASNNGAMQGLSYRYADGDTDLTRTNEYARSEIRKALGTEDAPIYKTRRFFDLVNQRVKDTLKLQAQNIWVTRLIIENPSLDDAGIAKLFYAQRKGDNRRIPTQIPVPTAPYVKRIRARLEKNNGVLPPIKPSFRTPKLQFSRTDTLGSVTFDAGRQHLLFTTYTPTGTVQLSFDVPGSDEFRTGKACMPDVILGDDGVIRLRFAVKHKARQAYEPECFLSVDVGVLYPFVATVVFKDGSRSQTVYPDESIMNKVDLIQNLSYQKERLMVKIDQNSRPSRAVHVRELAERQKIELSRLSNRISLVKKRVAQDCAHRVVGMALQHHAGMALEKLNWCAPSHSFDYALLQDTIMNLALRCGVPVRMVNAAGTSRSCPFDGGVLTQGCAHGSAVTVSPSRPCRVKAGVGERSYSSRGVSCPVCDGVFNRDGVGSLNVAVRACLDGKRGFVSRRVVRLRFKHVSLRVFAGIVADDTPIMVVGPSVFDVSGITFQCGPSVPGVLV